VFGNQRRWQDTLKPWGLAEAVTANHSQAGRGLPTMLSISSFRPDGFFIDRSAVHTSQPPHPFFTSGFAEFVPHPPLRPRTAVPGPRPRSSSPPDTHRNVKSAVHSREISFSSVDQVRGRRRPASARPSSHDGEVRCRSANEHEAWDAAGAVVLGAMNARAFRERHDSVIVGAADSQGHRTAEPEDGKMLLTTLQFTGQDASQQTGRPLSVRTTVANPQKGFCLLCATHAAAFLVMPLKTRLLSL
jgi:hypothetical protein